MNGMRSFVKEDSFLPFFLPGFFSTLKVIKDKDTSSIIVNIISDKFDILFRSSLMEFSFFQVISPGTFVNLAFCFILISSLSVFLVVFPLALEYVSVAVYHLAMALHFIIYKISFVDIIQPCNLKTTLTFSFILDKITLINITIAIINDSVAMKMSIQKSSFISFVFKSVSSFSIFFIIFELAIINGSTCLNENTTTTFLSHNKFTSIFSVLNKISQFSLAMEFIMRELSFIFYLSFQLVDSSTMFLAIVKLPCISSSIIFLQCSVMQLVVLEGSLKLLSVGIDELTIVTMFEIIFHPSDIFGSVRITDGSVDKIPSLELSIESAVSFLPDTFTMGARFFEISLIGVSIGVQKFSEGGVSFVKISFKL